MSSRISKLECTVYWLIQQPQAMARPISTWNLGVDSPSTTSISSHRSLSSISSSPSCDSIALADLTNISSPSKEIAHRSLIDEIIADKKARPLPKINKDKLSHPDQTVGKYPQFLCRSKLPTLAVKLCRESSFGPEIMCLCTVRGSRRLHALPEDTLIEMKHLIMGLSVPRFTPTKVEFEAAWKACLESVGQACKSLRLKD